MTAPVGGLSRAVALSPASRPGGEPRVTVVVATMNRRDSLRRTLGHLTELPGGPPVVVVDNGSTDGTAAMVGAEFPGVTLLGLDRNAGAPARNLGVAHAATPYVAFADDDSWWEPGALGAAVDTLDRHPRLAVVVARVLLVPSGAIDAVSVKMRHAPIGSEPQLPGPSVLGFPAFAAVCRRSAFLAAGGFSELLFFGGEEQLLAVDLAAAGWGLCYLDGVVAHHAAGDPGDGSPATGRWARQERNDVLVQWLRRPLATAALNTVRLAAKGVTDPAARRAAAGVLRRLPAALGRRRAVSPELADLLARAERPLHTG